MIDPIVFILAPPAAAFGWVAYDLRRRETQEHEVAAPATAPITSSARFAAPAEAPAPAVAFMSRDAA